MNTASSRILASIPLLLMLGCGLTTAQQKAARQFARASTHLGEVTAKELAHMREATIEMNEMNVALGGKANRGDLDKVFDPDDVQVRVAAARALSKYGALLLSLVEFSQEKELEKASDEFTSSFGSAVGKVGGMTLDDGQLEALGKVVQEVGGLVVERKRKQAVEEIVKTTHADVDRLCEYLIDDLDPSAGQMAQDFGSTISRLKNDAGAVLDDPPSATERARAAAALKRAGVERDRLDSVGAQMKKALVQLRAANLELVEVMDEKPSLKEMVQLGKDIRDLGDAVFAVAGR